MSLTSFQRTLGEDAFNKIVNALELTEKEEAVLYKIAGRIPWSLSELLSEKEILSLIAIRNVMNSEKAENN